MVGTEKRDNLTVSYFKLLLMACRHPRNSFSSLTLKTTKTAGEVRDDNYVELYSCRSGQNKDTGVWFMSFLVPL